jgi:hypothetical protein
MQAGERGITWRVALLVFLIASVFWLGAANVRVIIGNTLLQTGTLKFDEYLSLEVEREVFRLLSIISLVVISSYLLALFSSVVFLATMPFKLKEHGWLMMSAILFYLFVPVEAFTMVLDGKMVYLEFFTTTDQQVFRELFIARVAALSGVPFIAGLCYYTIIGLCVFQPLKKQQAAP